ncbi:MAG: hypothetical protein OJF49_004805 [Ktedonobacterales bacterium]|jgi:uncharacterized protein (DUF2252 family)|nr:MAG: hypothetical protein OJF49_004805 [Ktedonobacterales bacterium]
MATKTSSNPVAEHDIPEVEVHPPTAVLPEKRVARLTVAERQERGRALREKVPRSSHSYWVEAPDRTDPIALLESQAKTRLPDLVPIRYSRMRVSPFTFFRGSAIVMAHDLARTPITGIRTQLCGDCHLSNFGAYASPERTLMFDINDFDETLPGPWEWDMKRLAASFTVAGRGNGFTAAECREAVMTVVRSYREHMAEFAEMRDIEIWYSHVTAQNLLERLSTKQQKKQLQRTITKTESRGSLQAFDKMTEIVDGRHVIASDPPLLMRIPVEDQMEELRKLIHAYQQTLRDDYRHLLQHYQFEDLARKVVGVGSVGTRCFIALMDGRDEFDPLFLQVKEAEASVLESHLPKSAYRNQGERVVAGQRLMQAASDIFLGWIRGPEGRDFYFRQLRDMKGSAEIETMTPMTMNFYASICGWALARAHARTGDPIEISAYLGVSERFDLAIASFAEAYADQTERDHKAFLAAIKSGRIVAASSGQ